MTRLAHLRHVNVVGKERQGQQTEGYGDSGSGISRQEEGDPRQDGGVPQKQDDPGNAIGQSVSQIKHRQHLVTEAGDQQTEPPDRPHPDMGEKEAVMPCRPQPEGKFCPIKSPTSPVSKR